MTIQEFYEKIGGSFEDVLGRLKNESLIEKFALMYMNDTSFKTLMDAACAQNISDTFRAAHSLKGVAANLGFFVLNKAAADLTEQLRPQTAQADANLLDTVKAAHQQVIAALQEYQSEK